MWDDGENHFAFSCGPRSRKARDLSTNPHAAIMTESTVECLSLEGHAAPVHDTGRQDLWIERYLAKYRAISADLSAEFIRHNVIVEFVPTRAFGVIEREDEFATRATRWVFTRLRCTDRLRGRDDGILSGSRHPRTPGPDRP